MKTYESAVVIDRPPAEVFPFLIEPAKQALWSDVPMRQLTEGAFRKGTKFEVSFGKGRLTATLGLEITEFEQDRRMAWKTNSGPIDWEGEYVLAPAGESGTNLSQHGTLGFKGLWKMLEPMAGAEISSGEEKELARIKSLVEAAPAA